MNRGKSSIFSMVSVFMMLILASSAISAPNWGFDDWNGGIGASEDVEVLGIKPSTKSPEYGEKVVFRFAVRNNGKSPAAFTISLVPDLSAQDSPILPYGPAKAPFSPDISRKVKLSAGETLSGSFSFAYTKDFPELVRPAVIADSLEELDESDESNNLVSAKLRIVGSDPVDDCADHVPQPTVDDDQAGCITGVIEQHGLQDDALRVCDASIFHGIEDIMCYSGDELRYVVYQCLVDNFPLVDEEFMQCVGEDDGDDPQPFRRPDFTIEVEPILDVFNPEIFMGDVVHFKVTVRNLALPVMTTDFGIWFDDGTPSEVHKVNFALGTTYFTVIEHRFKEPGFYKVGVLVDPMDAQNEYYETNNRDTAGVTVLDEQQAEQPVFITDVDVLPLGDIEAGDVIRVQTTLENRVDFDAEDVQIKAWLPDLAVYADLEVTDVDAGETEEVNSFLEIPADAQPGDYTLMVSAAGELPNDDPWSDSVSRFITIVDNSQDEHALPDAVLDVTPLNGTAPLNVTIDGSGSFDSDGEIVKHTLMIEGPNDYFFGLVDVAGAPGVVERTFTDAGEYHIQLIVEDDEACGAIADEYVTVLSDDSGDDSGDDGDDDGDDDGNDDSDDDSDDDGNDGDDDGDDDGNDDSDDDSDDDGNDEGDEGPDISGIEEEDITDDSATISWETDVDADARVEYGTDEDDLDEDEYDDDLEEDHKIVLEDLDEDTKYYYMVISCDEDDHCTEEGPYHFTTEKGDDDSWSDDDDDQDDWDDWDSFEFSSPDDDVSDAQDSGDGSAVVVTSGGSEPEIEVVYSPIEYIEVEEKVCGFRFLWWCLWEETVTREVPVPSSEGGMQFFI